MVNGLNGEVYLTSNSSYTPYASCTDAGNYLARITPAGKLELIAKNICGKIQGVVPMADGSMYLACATGLHRRSSSGVLTKLNAIAGDGLAMGPDGYLYMSQTRSHTIYKVSVDGNATVYLDSSKISYPSRLAFTPTGELLVACDYYGDVLRKFKAGGGSYEDMFVSTGTISSTIFGILVDPDGGLTLSTAGGFYRYGPDGRGERLTYSRSMWISKTPVDIAQKISKLDGAIRKGTDWLLASGNASSTENITLAQLLIGLGSARGYYDGQPIANTIQVKMEAIGTLLRSRQNADGGWGTRVNQASDSMVTAQVGVALDYLNPVAGDPVIRKAVQWLLSRQRADGTWISENGLMSTPLAATTWVIIWLPIALDRLGGIDTDLSVITPANVELSNPTLVPTSTQVMANGETSYLWKLPSVKNAGQDIGFDLNLRDMVPGENRSVATDAHLLFNNTFTQQPVTAPIEIPKVAASAFLDLTLSTDKPLYGANEPVNLDALVTNTGVTASSGLVDLAIYAADGTPVADPVKRRSSDGVRSCLLPFPLFLI